FGECDGVEDRDAFPRTEDDVVDPTAIGLRHVPLGPVVDHHGGAEILAVSGRVRDAEQRIDRVTATAMDHGAGWAEESAVESGVCDIRDLMFEQAVTPALEKCGVEVRRCSGSCEGEVGGERCRGGGGEMEEVAASGLQRCPQVCL